MPRRRDTLLLIGAVIITIGGALYLNPFHNEPLSVEWLLGPALVYFGLPVAIIGVAMHFYDGTADVAGSTVAPRVPKAHR
jgi:hypothetical protein